MLMDSFHLTVRAWPCVTWGVGERSSHLSPTDEIVKLSFDFFRKHKLTHEKKKLFQLSWASAESLYANL
jgi:hypothetical protein